MLILKQT